MNGNKSENENIANEGRERVDDETVKKLLNKKKGKKSIRFDLFSCSIKLNGEAKTKSTRYSFVVIIINVKLLMF